jgi:hypothetical protein
LFSTPIEHHQCSCSVRSGGEALAQGFVGEINIADMVR